jgi:Tfp pilus assembly protein PilF
MSWSRKFWIFIIFAFISYYPCWAQGGEDLATRQSGASPWRVFGWVLTSHADPLSDVEIQLDAGSAAESWRSTRTNSQGEFQAEIPAGSNRPARLRGTILARKTGYVEGRDSFDFGVGEKPKAIVIVLRELNEDASKVSLDTLSRASAPQSTSITWRVVGRIQTAHADPLSDVDVQLEAGSTAELRRSVKTNLQGEFLAEIRTESSKSARLRGTIVANKTGYLEGHASFDFGVNEKPKGIAIVLRNSNEDPDQLSMASLMRILAQPLRDRAAKNLPEESGRKELLRGCEQLIVEQKAVAAASLLKASVARLPDCLDCRLLLSLALLSAGNWGGAETEIELALKTDNESPVKRPEPILLIGIIQAWAGRANDAAKSYLRALEVDPENSLALQELGRAFVALKNWDSADQYLEKALAAGAGDDARLLRTRALLELGDVSEAAREMDLYASNREIKDLPQVARILASEVQARRTLQSYGQVKSIIAQSPEELIKALPYLQGLKAASDQSLLQEVLHNTGAGVEAFFRDFPNTVSLERVRQERLGKDGKAKASRNQEFQYLLLAHTGIAGLGIEEHRSTAEGTDAAQVGLHQGLMLTSGFASASSLFHPINRSGSDFRYLGKQEINGREAHVIAFAQKPETARNITRFVTDGGSALILVQGVAWVDAESFHILRLYTGLLNPLSKIRLQKQTTEIQFRQMAFNGGSTTLWLPEEVEVTVDWKGRVLRNLHRYSDFKLFNVDAREEGKPQHKLVKSE